MFKGLWFIQQMFIEHLLHTPTALDSGSVINEIDQIASSIELVCPTDSLILGDFRRGFACAIIEAGQWDGDSLKSRS